MIKRILLTIILITITVTAFANEASKALVARLSQLNTMQASFKQDLFANNGRLLEKYHGKMALKRPNLFYWEIQDPLQQRMIADGSTVWTYDLDLAQVTAAKQVAGKAMTPAEFLGGDIKRLLRYFRVSQQGQTFQLKALNRAIDFKEISFLFDNNVLKAMRLVDRLNQTSDIYFTNIQYNKPLNNKKFNFVPPRGVEIVQQ